MRINVRVYLKNTISIIVKNRYMYRIPRFSVVVRTRSQPPTSIHNRHIMIATSLSTLSLFSLFVDSIIYNWWVCTVEWGLKSIPTTAKRVVLFTYNRSMNSTYLSSLFLCFTPVCSFLLLQN